MDSLAAERMEPQMNADGCAAGEWIGMDTDGQGWTWVDTDKGANWPLEAGRPAFAEASADGSANGVAEVFEPVVKWNRR